MIELAYAVADEQEISGGPAWIRTERFDITAKVDEAEAQAFSKLSPYDLKTQLRLMLQSLLEERFHLQVSFATKQLPLFALVVAKGGFKRTIAPAPSNLVDPGGPLPPPPPPPPPPPLPPTGGQTAPGTERPMHWSLHKLPFAIIVGEMSYQPELGGRALWWIRPASTGWWTAIYPGQATARHSSPPSRSKWD